MKHQVEFTIDEGDDGIRLDRWFKRHHPHITHALLQKHLRKGAVRLNGKKAETSARLEAGHVLSLPTEMVSEAVDVAPKERKKQEYPPQIAREMEKSVLFKNKHCLVINKSPDLPVQGGSGVKDSVDHRLDLLAFGGERPKLVHRLDRDTSGCLLLARSTNDAAALAKAFSGKTIQKTYWALVIGVPEVEEAVIKLPIGKIRVGGEEKMVIDEKDGKRSVSEYKVLGKVGNKLSLVQLIPVTGRTHQLRVHMAAIGHPILSDGKYGGRDAFMEGMELPRKLHLHARRLQMEKPFTLDVTAPLPKHMQESFRIFGFEAGEYA